MGILFPVTSLSILIGLLSINNIALFKFLYSINNPASLVIYNFDSGSSQGLKCLWTAKTGKKNFSAFITDHGGSLNASSFESIFIFIIVKDFKFQSFRIYR